MSFKYLICAVLFVTAYADTKNFKSQEYETNINKAETKTVFQRKLTETKTNYSLGFNSHNENSGYNNRHFTFNMKPTAYGILLKYQTDVTDLNKKEITHVMFQKLFEFKPMFNKSYVNETMENQMILSNDKFNKINCTSDSDTNHRTCTLKTLDNTFEIIVEYSSTPFQKQSFVITKTVFSTDIKVTLIFNKESRPSYNLGLITSFKTDTRDEVEQEDHKLYTTDKVVNTGNYTYFSFESIAITELEKIVDVTMTKSSISKLRDKNIIFQNYSDDDVYDETNDSDNSDNSNNSDDQTEKSETFTIFSFSTGENFTKIIWDPVVGASTAFTGIDLTQTQSASSSSSNNFPVYGIVLIAIGSVFIVFGIIGFTARHKSSSSKQDDETIIKMETSNS